MARAIQIASMSPSQAKYILEKLIDEKTVSAADVRRHLADMWEEMSALEKRITELRDLAGSVHPVRRLKQAVQRVAKRAKRAAKTPEAAASRKLQGQYIAHIRQVPKRQRKRFAEIAKTDGREAAIAAIKKQFDK